MRQTFAPRKDPKDKRLSEEPIEEIVADIEKAKKAAAKGKEVKEELEDLLDEIDSLLEENAAEFVAAYVQKNGE